MRIPSTADPDVQSAFREVWKSIDRVQGGQNLDFKGKRIINAGRAVDPADYVTRFDVDQAISEAIAKLDTVPDGTLNAKGLTKGSVIFSLGGDRVGQDNANFFWDNTLKNLGLGTKTPLARLHVVRSLVPAALFDGVGFPSEVYLRSAAGAIGAPTALGVNADLGTLGFGGYDGSAYQIKGKIVCTAAENWSGTATGTFLEFFTTKKTTTFQLRALKLFDDKSFEFPGVGPHAIGGVADTKYGLYVRGAFTATTSGVTAGTFFEQTVQPSAANQIGGVVVASTPATAASGVHAFVAQLHVVGPAITINGTASVTDAATVFISSAPTGATNNYALWVDNGKVRIDGRSATNVSVPSGRLQINVDGTDYYLGLNSA